MTDLLLRDIEQLTTNTGDTLSRVNIGIDDGRISYVGTEIQAATETIDCTGRGVIPGFVDAHTHLVFAGDRADEFADRLRGATYQEIAASGGGILSTVNATRVASEGELFDLAAARVARMVESGTTAMEIKSGYGLDHETEVRLLQVARRLRDEMPVTIKTTFLGAHSVPPEFRNHRDGYIRTLIDEMIPEAAELADYCDVFVEEGVFTVDEGRQIFEAADARGMRARVHAEQLTHSGGAALAAEIGAASADHLDHATKEDAKLLAEAGVAAVLVPGASYTLRASQAPGPMLWDAGCTVALATDCNPGTSYFEGLGPVISLAAVQMGLTVQQSIWAATRGGALSLGLDDRGLVTEGAVADLVILDAPSAAHIPYRPATNLVWKTIRAGRVVAG